MTDIDSIIFNSQLPTFFFNKDEFARYSLQNRIYINHRNGTVIGSTLIDDDEFTFIPEISSALSFFCFT